MINSRSSHSPRTKNRFAPRGFSPQGEVGLTGSGCLSADGINFIQSINGNDPVVQPNMFTGFNLSFWFKFTSVSGRLLLAQGNTSDVWDTSLYANGNYASRYSDYSFGDTITGISVDTWHHLLIYNTFTSNAFSTVWLDGVFKISDGGSPNSSASANYKFTIFSYNFSPSGTPGNFLSNDVKIARMTYWSGSNTLDNTDRQALYNGGGLYDFQVNPSGVPAPTWNYDFGNNYFFDGSNYRMYQDNTSNPSFYQAGSGGTTHDFNVITALFDTTDHPNYVP